MTFLEKIFGKPKYDYPKSKFQRHVDRTMKHVHKLHWRYQNVVYIAISLGVAYAILVSGVVNQIGNLGSLGYVSSFFFGLLLSYGATAAPAVIGLFVLGKNFNPFLISLLAAAGSTITDLILFHFIKTRWTPHIENALKFFKIRWQLVILKIEKSRFFQIIIPVAAGFMIASPLPNEIAVFLLGAVKYGTKKFAALAYIFHFIGILIIVLLGQTF